MKFSSLEEYGLRCLVVIGKAGTAGSATIAEISRKEGITEPYVAKLLMILRKGGFINSTRGQSGGYALARKPEEIVIGDVMAALGGKLYAADFCERHSGQQATCSHVAGCSIKSLWNRVQDAVDSVVDHITLSDLLCDEAANSLIQVQTTPAPRQPKEAHA
jgi:Rrf2 family iron-sulfur cluster assembly transcriptional regulator